jgi:hypothetical protein
MIRADQLFLKFNVPIRKIDNIEEGEPFSIARMTQ